MTSAAHLSWPTMFGALGLTMAVPNAPALAQCDFSLTSWEPLSLDGTVKAMVKFNDGSGGHPKLVIGGTLTQIGNLEVNRIASWDGMTWSALGEGLAGAVSTLGVFEQRLYASFSSPGSSGTSRWNGVEWESLGSTVLGDFAAFDDPSNGEPTLYAGGSGFYKLAGSNWEVVSACDGYISKLKVFDDGAGAALYAAGSFTSIDGVAANSIAKWNGAQWSALGQGVGGAVWELIVYKYADAPALYVGGNFANAGGIAADNVAAWTGGAWAVLPAVNGTLRALGKWNDGSGSGSALFAAHKVTNPNNEYNHMELRKWDGSSWSDVGGLNDNAGDCYSDVNIMMPYDDGSGSGSMLVVAGDFFIPGLPCEPHSYNCPFKNFGRFDGETWFAVTTDPVALLGGYVSELVANDDGSEGLPAGLYAAGHSGSSGGASNSNIVRWDGQTWSSFGEGAADPVTALTIHSDGSGNGPALYAGGYFLSVGDLPANHIARWDGTSWSAMGSGTNQAVLALQEFDNDGSGANPPRLYAGGAFTHAGGNPAEHIARWNGNVWSPVAGGLTGGSVLALAVFDEPGPQPARLFAAGSFTGSNGVPINHIAKLDGSSWIPLGAGLGASHQDVRALAVFDDDGEGPMPPALYAGGSFTLEGGAASSHIAKWDGTAWWGVPPPDLVIDTVEALCVFDHGLGPALFAGGFGESVLARWNGESWRNLGAENTIDGVVAVTGFEGALYIGGTEPALSRWSSTGATLAITDQSIGTGTWDAALEVDVVYADAVAFQWRREGEPLEDVPPYSGVHTDRLYLDNVLCEQAATYDVVISNDCTTLVSEAMVVDVLPLGDVTGDNLVNYEDVLAVVGAWGPCANPDCPADLSSDGLVDMQDLWKVIHWFGTCDQPN